MSDPISVSIRSITRRTRQSQARFDRSTPGVRDNVQFNDLASSICNVHRAKPSGGVEQARAIRFASLAPSKIRRLAEFGDAWV